MLTFAEITQRDPQQFFPSEQIVRGIVISGDAPAP